MAMDVASETVTDMDTNRLMEVIPHLYPFLMIDRMVDIITHVSATGIRNVTVNEPYFQGHFPGQPVMPGVLIIEAMAQTSAALVVHSMGPHAEGKLVYFMSIESARFRKPVVPGDRLNVHVTKERSRGNVWKFSAEAKVDGVVVAEATYAAMILDK